MAQPTTAFGNRSLEDMRNLVYAGIRRKSTDPLTGLSATFVNGYIAKWDAFFVDAARWNFDTFKRQKMIAFKSGTSIYSAYTSGDAYIELTDNTNAASGGGRISINGDLVDYSAKDTPTSGKSITLTAAGDGVYTPDIDHVAGERVEFLVEAPSDLGKPGEIWVVPSGGIATAKFTHKSWREMPIPRGRYYTYLDGFLIFPQNLNSMTLQLHYWKKGLKLASGENLQTPEKWDDFVKYAAMAECYIITKEFDKAAEMFALAGAPTPGNPDPIGLLQHAMAEDAEQTDSEDDVFIPDLGSYHL